MTRRTTFEDVPDDVILDLFEYFTVDQLIHTFSSLNSRYQSLLTHVKHRFSTRTGWIYDYVTILIVQHGKNFIKEVHRQTLANIRHLILAQPAREQWNHIDGSVFPYLQHLELVDSVFTYRTETICHRVFSGNFSHLQKCPLSFVPYRESNLWQFSVSLRVLRVGVMDVRVYERIFTACPNLNRLTMRLCESFDKRSASAAEQIQQHPHLRKLTLLPIRPVSCDLIDYFLRFVPNLESFSLKESRFQSKSAPLKRLYDLSSKWTPAFKQMRWIEM